MKKLLLLSLLAISFGSTNAQITTSLGLGAGIDHSKALPALHFQAGYHTVFGEIVAGYVTELSRRTDAGALFFLKYGKGIPVSEKVEATPSIGYGYMLRSVDQKQLNESLAVYGLELSVQTGTPQARLYVAGNITKEAQFFSAGIKFLIFRSSTRTCN